MNRRKHGFVQFMAYDHVRTIFAFGSKLQNVATGMLRINLENIMHVPTKFFNVQNSAFAVRIIIFAECFNNW